MSLIDPANPSQGLRRTTIPTLAEFDRTPGEEDDPLGEDGHSPVPGLVHRYPDRVLLLVTNFCSVYCRYCTRARLVGASGERALRKADIDRAIEYIAATPAVRDCLISGGDPLSLDEDRLEYVLSRLRAIPHLEFIRIGSKQPVVQPMRVTPALTKMLRRYHPIWMSLHFTHPDEVTPEVAEACGRLADAGIPLGSQTVLLKGVNDDVATLKKLFHALLKIRVRPYYLYQCDPISGSSHFRTTRRQGPRDHRGSCAATRPATPCRTTSSTPPAAAARSRCCRTPSSAATATTCCCATSPASSAGIPIPTVRSASRKLGASRAQKDSRCGSGSPTI